MKFINRNTLWAKIFVSSLVNAGLEAVCISPGSRSTPLAMAFYENPRIEVFSILDERGAGYFAIGMANEKKKTIALVCTSGTAVANYFPAVVEANYSNIPLLLLTADRPHELRDSGANQSIDQIKIFGDHVRWFVDLALPEANPSLKTLRYIHNIAARCISKTQSVHAGPVHINMPFRKPLEPTEVLEDFSPEWYRENELAVEELIQSKLEMGIGKISPTIAQVEGLVALIKNNPNGLIICGPKTPGGEFPEKITELAKKTNYPLLIDSLSGLRFNSKGENQNRIAGHEGIFASKISGNISDPGLILQFGYTPISKSLQSYLSRLDNTHRIQVSANGVWADEDYKVNEQIWVDPLELTCEILDSLKTWKPKENDYLKRWKEVEEITWGKTLDMVKKEWFEGAVVSEMLDIMPENTDLFVASSLPIRHLDQFGKPSQKNIRVFANRGASGIDGTISSALGVAAASQKRIVLLIGDLSFYHDLNALLAVNKFDLKVTIVLINNDGGGIFRRLPISDYDPQFTELFLTPHGLTFEKTADQFSIDYKKIEERESFIKIFEESVNNNNKSMIIEVVGDSEKHEDARKELIKLLDQEA